jgi:hypothetical protein
MYLQELNGLYKSPICVPSLTGAKRPHLISLYKLSLHGPSSPISSDKKHSLKQATMINEILS